jgi:hypothetical protein
MSHKQRLLVVLVAVISSAVRFAGAQSAAPFQAESLDDNGDGVVTTEEFEAAMLGRWASNDLNQDGKVTLEELKPRLVETRGSKSELRAPAGAKRSRTGPAASNMPGDSDGDGAVSEAEALVVAQDLATRIDANADGILSPDELGAPLSSKLRVHNLKPG